jgi:hypothetical protein
MIELTVYEEEFLTSVCSLFKFFLLYLIVHYIMVLS